MKKTLKVLFIICLIPIVLTAVLLLLLSKAPAAPSDYTTDVETAGTIESRYMAVGKYEVESITAPGDTVTKMFTIYYPKQMLEKHGKYPLIVMLNGTGVLPKKYKSVFKHLASWGFVVIGNEDPSAGNGLSADQTIHYILAENGRKSGIFYNKLDTMNIGVIGHSQGGAGVFSALSVIDNRDRIKTAVALSPTYEEMADTLGWKYDLTLTNVPILMMAGTKGDFETKLVIPLDNMKSMYRKMSAMPKVMMRRKNADHGQMLYAANGYATAWLVWQLQHDDEAGRAFMADDAEIFHNPLYQDVAREIVGNTQ